ncbi:MAG: hypothetical protein HUJ53_09470 [Holdemanella sp.]|nr:hypothetical protein [Holdemanella sp.]
MTSIAYYQSLLVRLHELKGELPSLCCSQEELQFVSASIDRLINQIYVQMNNVEIYESKHRQS